MFPPPNPLIPRLVVIKLTCGHTVTLGIPPEVDPRPGDDLHCYTCDQGVLVVSVTPHADAVGADPRVGPSDDPATTPILHHGGRA